MSDETQSPAVASEESGATDLQVLNGGIEIDAVKIDGSSDKVKVRQLSVALLGAWGNSQGDEAYLVELLCDKIDRTTVYHLANARMAEMRVHEILQQAPFAQIEPIEKRLAAIREEIARHEAKPRWSDELTHETVAEIRELGERLNKKKFVDQVKRKTAASKILLEMITPSPSPTSSSPSLTTAESPSGM